MRVKLKAFRIIQGLTQSEMANKLKLARITYSSIERGERDTSQKVWERLQKCFNIPDADMWGLMKKQEVTK